MKILLLTTHLDMGGIAVYVVNLAKHLKRSGHEAVIVSGGGKLESWLSDYGIRHVRMDIRAKSEFGWKAMRAVMPLTRMVREEKFDVMHAQTRLAQVIACMAGKLTGVPYVTTCHGFFKHARLGRRLFPCWGSRTIAISKSVAGHLTGDFKLLPEQVHQIYNGIETGKYSIGLPEKDAGLFRDIGLHVGIPVIGTVGRLSSVKGHRYLIDAFRRVIAEGHKAQLLIVGDGPEHDNIERQIRESGISDCAFLNSGGARMEAYLSLIDIYCMPSVDEGFGLSLVEAMASGRACVASDVGGIAEIISNGMNGLLVPPCDAKGLGEAVIRLLRDGLLRERLAAAARGKALSDFRIEDSVARTVKVYEEAIKEKEKGKSKK